MALTLLFVGRRCRLHRLFFVHILFTKDVYNNNVIEGLIKTCKDIGPPKQTQEFKMKKILLSLAVVFLSAQANACLVCKPEVPNQPVSKAETAEKKNVKTKKSVVANDSKIVAVDNTQSK